MITFQIFTICIILVYTFLIISFLRGWDSIGEYKLPDNFNEIFVSVIIAFRNEEKNLPLLFKSLKNQIYPVNAFEIIFCNDHSSDESVDLVNAFISDNKNSRLIHLTPEMSGKKKALEFATLEAKGNLLIFTDADCEFRKTWVSSFVSYYLIYKPVLIAGPVIISPSPGFFNKFQSLEFYSLMGSTGGSFGIKKPIMLNGANLAVEREVYCESFGNLENRSASGDDIFLLLYLKRKYSQKLHFLKSSDAIVSVKPAKTLSDFIHQRLRWTSKSKYYTDPSILYTAITVLLINFYLLLCIIFSFFTPSFIGYGLFVFCIKSIVDFVFLRKILRFFNESELLRVFVLSQFLYFLYVSFIGISGNFLPSNWKGRRVI